MKAFSKKYIIKAGREAVYTALTNAKEVAAWSGSPAKMNAKPASAFSLWEGSIHGKNVTVSRKKIVQQWKEKGWDNYTTVSFIISEAKGITTVELIHEGIPDTSFKSIKNGWDEYYMLPLKAHVESQINPIPFLNIF
ncbi:MAG: SRPBCC domain-containing protein [Ginsengibacter sp.]